MRPFFEFSTFLAIATVSHLAVFQGAEIGADASSGAAGHDTITLAASTQSVAAMVEHWDRPVEAVQEVAMPVPVAPTNPQTSTVIVPDTSQTPPRPAPPAMSPLASGLEGLPNVDTTAAPPAPDLTVASSPRPKTRPLAKPKPVAKSTPRTKPAPRQTASGSGRNQASGVNGPATAATKKQTTNPAQLAQWGGRVRAAIERRKRYPSGTQSRGKVTLSIAVTSSGALSSVRVRRSSGSAVLDKAALTAVQRARFPAAPRGVSKGVHHFTLPISFAP